eukprot:15463771-Alexandrium_andersonii.AAC.1
MPFCNSRYSKFGIPENPVKPHRTVPAERPLRNRRSRSQNTAPVERPLPRKKSRQPTWSIPCAVVAVLDWRHRS